MSRNRVNGENPQPGDFVWLCPPGDKPMVEVEILDRGTYSMTVRPTAGGEPFIAYLRDVRPGDTPKSVEKKMAGLGNVLASFNRVFGTNK